MTEIELDDLAACLEERMGMHDVELSDVTSHVEGWSRNTVSFTATWDEDRKTREQRLVVRVESDVQTVEQWDLYGDIAMEFRTIETMAETAVPIPDVYFYEADDAVLGAPFFVMEHLEGNAPVVWSESWRERLYEMWDSEARSVPRQFVTILSKIHDVSSSELPKMERLEPSEVVDRKIDRWESIFEEASLVPEPAIEEALRWFRANKPTIPETTLVHGDYRVGNMLIEDDTITGILDWELAEIGDPMYDLGYASTHLFAGKLIDYTERPELACSLLEREWFYDEYEDRTGRAVDRERVRYWRAFTLFLAYSTRIADIRSFNEGNTDDVRKPWAEYMLPGIIEDLIDLIEDDRLGAK